MKLSREIKTAILVLLGIAFFIFGFNYLKGKNIFNSNHLYHTEFTYNALTVGAPVTIKGNAIGRVENIKYDFNTGKTRVEFSVNKAMKFSKNSKIRLYETGLMGGNAIAIIPAESGNIALNGDLLTSEVEEGLVASLSKNFSGLSTGLDGTLKSADSLLLNINTIVADNSDKGLKNTLVELNQTIKSFKVLSNTFKSLISKNDQNITTIVSNFKTVSQDLAILSTELKDIKLANTVGKLDETMQNVNTLMANLKAGKGAMGKLLNDDKLYKNLEGASKQMEQLLQDFKLNPKRYIHFSVFGKRPKQYDAEGNEIKDKK